MGAERRKIERGIFRAVFKLFSRLYDLLDNWFVFPPNSIAFLLFFFIFFYLAKHGILEIRLQDSIQIEIAALFFFTNIWLSFKMVLVFYFFKTTGTKYNITLLKNDPRRDE